MDFPIGYPDHLIVSPRDEETVFVVRRFDFAERLAARRMPRRPS